jgi:hypothetical protein
MRRFLEIDDISYRCLDDNNLAVVSLGVFQGLADLRFL